MPAERNYFKNDEAGPWALRYSEGIDPDKGRPTIDVDLVLDGAIKGRLSMARSVLPVNVVLPLLERRAKAWIHEFRAEGEDATTDFAGL